MFEVREGMLALPGVGAEIVIYQAGKHSCCQTWSSHSQSYQFTVLSQLMSEYDHFYDYIVDFITVDVITGDSIVWQLPQLLQASLLLADL